MKLKVIAQITCTRRSLQRRFESHIYEASDVGTLTFQQMLDMIPELSRLNMTVGWSLTTLTETGQFIEKCADGKCCSANP